MPELPDSGSSFTESLKGTSFKNTERKRQLRPRADPDRLPAGYIIPHRQEDEKCPKCGTGIKKSTIAGRTSYFCPRCQQ